MLDFRAVFSAYRIAISDLQVYGAWIAQLRQYVKTIDVIKQRRAVLEYTNIPIDRSMIERLVVPRFLR
jgi:hypothetical protein